MRCGMYCGDVKNLGDGGFLISVIHCEFIGYITDYWVTFLRYVHELVVGKVS